MIDLRNLALEHIRRGAAFINQPFHAAVEPCNRFGDVGRRRIFRAGRRRRRRRHALRQAIDLGAQFIEALLHRGNSTRGLLRLTL